jgi:hypothetical protein
LTGRHHLSDEKRCVVCGKEYTGTSSRSVTHPETGRRYLLAKHGEARAWVFADGRQATRCTDRHTADEVVAAMRLHGGRLREVLV